MIPGFLTIDKIRYLIDYLEAIEMLKGQCDESITQMKHEDAFDLEDDAMTRVIETGLSDIARALEMMTPAIEHFQDRLPDDKPVSDIPPEMYWLRRKCA